MIGFLPSPSKIAFLRVAGLMLSFGTTASYADSAEQIAIAREGVSVTSPAPPALHRDRVQPNRSNECIGGYRWTQRAFNVHREQGQMSLPLPCR